MQVRTINLIELEDWDYLVSDTYGRPYSFQQQDGCKTRGVHRMQVPDFGDDFENETIPNALNGSVRGVSFKSWLDRNPKDRSIESSIRELWWYRNFYPNVQMIANDLYDKGLLEAGNYLINIDW